MEQVFSLLQDNALFQGLAASDIGEVWPCLSPDVRSYDKGELILCADELIPGVGVMLEGVASVAREEEDGHRVVLAVLGAGDLFAEAFVCAGLERSPVTVMAEGAARVAFLSLEHVLGRCARNCAHHSRITANLLRVLARKSLSLRAQIDLLSMRTLRDKLTAYLASQAAKSGSRRFDVPLDRSGLAEYLGVDRSALSRELSNMKRDGLIDYHKNAFHLLSSRKSVD